MVKVKKKDVNKLKKKKKIKKAVRIL